MRKLLTRFLTTLLLLISFAIYFPANIYAANSCDLELDVVQIDPGESVTVTASNIVFEDSDVESDSQKYFLRLTPSGETTPMINVVNGQLTFTLDYDFFNNSELSYNFELKRNNWGNFGSTSICTSSESVYVASADSTSCSSYSFSPTSGEAGTPFTLTATGCVPGTTYGLRMAYDSDFSNEIEAIPQYYDGGPFSMSITPTIPGTYRVFFGDVAKPLIVYYQQGGIVITEPEEEITFQCGSTGVPQNTPRCSDTVTTNCCPAECRWDLIPEPGTGNDISMCACGTAGRACCPGNTCQYEMNDTVFCNSENICETADFGDVVHQCGEAVRSDAICDVRCPLEPIDLGINLYWCACGTDGGACCETGNPCQGDGFICTDGSCLLPEFDRSNLPIQCSSGEDGFDTALGCFNYTDITQGTLTIIRFFIGVGGGVTLLLIAYAAFLIMVSAGNPRMLQRGKEVLTSAILGLIMFALSALILRVIGIDLLGLF